MMHRKILVMTLVFMLLQSSLINTITAETGTDANVYGHVVQKDNGTHLPFMSVGIKGTTLGTYTDATGHYFLKNLPVGKHILVASGVGYKSKEIEIEMIANRTIEVDFELETDVMLLSSVVVSANRTETNRKEAPVIVNVLSGAVLTQTNSLSVSDGLSFQPGLRVETNCQNCGFQQVRINGLDGPYSQILIDSRPVFSSLAGIYGLEQIPANMVDRVEVVRGGGSALFGSSAIAGTINIITKEPSSNTIEIQNNTRFIGIGSPDVVTGMNASVVSDNHKSGLTMFGSVRQRSPYDHDNDGFTEITAIKSSNVGFKGYYRANLYQRLTAEYHNISEFRRGGDHLLRPPHEANLAEQLDHKIHTGSIGLELFSKNFMRKLIAYSTVQHIDRKSYFGANQDLDAYGATRDLAFVAGTQYNHSLPHFLFMPSDVTLGAEYSANDLHDKALGYNRDLKQTIHIGSFYVQNEWKNRHWSILAGSRIDHHNLLGKPVISPRLSVRHNLGEWVNLRAGYSTGFRAPQAYDEDLHIRIAGGEALLVSIDPDLKPENSSSITLSADFYHSIGSMPFNLLIEGFYTSLQNVFVLEQTVDAVTGDPLLFKTNGSGAVVRGITIEGRLVPSKTINAQYGFTLQKSLYEEPHLWSEVLAPQKQMFRTPNHYGYFTTQWQTKRPWLIAVSGTYTGKMLVQHYAGYIEKDREVTTPSFFDLTIKFTREVKLDAQSVLRISAGVQNILNQYQKDFDQGSERDAGYIYGPAGPRTLFLGIRFRI